MYVCIDCLFHLNFFLLYNEVRIMSKKAYHPAKSDSLQSCPNLGDTKLINLGEINIHRTK